MLKYITPVYFPLGVLGFHLADTWFLGHTRVQLLHFDPSIHYCRVQAR